MTCIDIAKSLVDALTLSKTATTDAYTIHACWQPTIYELYSFEFLATKWLSKYVAIDE